MNSKFLKEVLRVFLFSFVGAFLPLLTGIWVSPDWSARKAALVAALIAAFSAGVKAATDALTKGVPPLPNKGILDPSIKV